MYTYRCQHVNKIKSGVYKINTFHEGGEEHTSWPVNTLFIMPGTVYICYIYSVGTRTEHSEQDMFCTGIWLRDSARYGPHCKI